MATTVDYVLKVTSDKAQKALGAVADKADKMGSSLQSNAKKIGASMVAVAGAVAAAGVAVVAFGQKIADLANEMSDASTKTGLAIDTLQGLKLAAEGSGLQFSNLENGLIRFQSSITNAIEGTGAASDAFRDLGIDLFDANGDLKSADQLFRETTDALGAMESATLRNSKAIDLFGQRAGPALAQSGALGNMKAFADFASEFGINMQDAADDAADFQRGMAEIGTVTEGLASDFLKIITGTNSLSDALFAVSDTIVFFGTITREVFSGVRDVLKATGQIAFFNYANNVIRAMIVAKTALDGNIDKAAQLTKAYTLMAKGDALRSAELLSEGIDKITGSAAEAQQRLELLREQRSKIMSTDAAGARGEARGKSATEQAAKTAANLSQSIELIPLKINDGFRAASITLFETLSPLEEAMISVKNGILAAGKFIQDVGAAITSPDSFVNAIAGAAGPIGEAIGGALGTLAKLGERTPEEIEAQFLGFAEAVGKGLENLPAILIRVLPRFVIALIRGIGEAILNLPALIGDAIKDVFGGIWESIKEFFRSIFTKEGRRERRCERDREPSEAAKFFSSLFTGQAMLGGGRMLTAQSGIRFTGAKRGLAMLHEGETVIPASGRTGQAEQRSMGSMGGSPINIVINSAVVENRAIDELVRRLESRFSTFGAGKSSLFGR